MNASVTRRLLILSTALTLLALLIGWSAFVSWRAIRKLRSSVTTSQIESSRIADHVQGEVLKLDSLLLKYRSSRSDEDWRSFENEVHMMNSWLDQQKAALATPEEKALLDEIRAASDSYLAAANQIAGGARPLDQLPKVEAAEQRMLNVGLELAHKHHEALARLATSTQHSVTLIQGVVFAALLGLLLLAGWAAVFVYREMIAPLRVELMESKALAARREKLASLGILAAGVAHEIRNPLTAIKARLYTQQKALTPGSRERTDAEFIGREIDRLEKIVNDFLRFARPVEPERVPLSPSDLLGAVRELLTPQLRESSIDLVVEHAVETEILADPEQLKQVLINLVQNAAEATGQSGTITLRAVKSRVLLGGRTREVVMLEVEDNGPGIPPDVQQRLFDPFFTTKPSGTGLGLSIAARIMEKHGGALRFRTTANRGTTFGIVLPLQS